MENAVELIDVYKRFGDVEHGQEVLKGLTLKVPRGAITMIIGYSGAGKSVMLKHILGLMQPDRGLITVLNQDVTHMDEVALNELRKRFGMLFQSAALFDDMTAIDNVAFPINEFFRRKLSRRDTLIRAAKKLHDVGLARHDFYKFPSELSGGMRKRVGLARALALEPEILLYDEPTTGLDPIMSEMVDNLIVETHHKRKGLTSIVITHDMAAAFRIGDYVAMLDNGHIRLFGTPDDFLKSEDPVIRRFVEKVVRGKTS